MSGAPEIAGWLKECGSRERANAHLSDDETVAKMGHPIHLLIFVVSMPTIANDAMVGIRLFG